MGSTTTQRIYDLKNIIYHCVTRKEGEIIVYETPMNLINIDKIGDIKLNNSDKGISFNDGKDEYCFYQPKSTLLKQFIAKDILCRSSVKILDDPLEVLQNLIRKEEIFTSPEHEFRELVYLPLYSEKEEKKVPLKSGLNQWNAGGRKRDQDEVYIPIPAWIHRVFPNFFPPKDVSFNLRLPNKEILIAKVCQDNSKALMSNPNSQLGKWILRDILQLNPGELASYKKLEEMGIDSVIVFKIDDSNYEIDFRKIDSYKNFKALKSFSS